MELGQLFIDVGVSESSLSNIENKLKAKAAKISNFTLTPRIDDSQLTKLNQHLDLKVRHLNQVSNIFAAKRITPSVDLSQLNLLNRTLSEISNNSTQIAVSIDIAQVSSQVGNLQKQLSSLVLSPKIVLDSTKIQKQLKVTLKDLAIDEIKLKLSHEINVNSEPDSKQKSDDISKEIIKLQQITKSSGADIGILGGVKIAIGQDIALGMKKALMGVGFSSSKTSERATNYLLQKTNAQGHVNNAVDFVASQASEVKNNFPTTELNKRIDTLNNRLSKFATDFLKNQDADIQKRNIAKVAESFKEIRSFPGEIPVLSRKQAIDRAANEVLKSYNPLSRQLEPIPEGKKNVVFGVGGYAGQKGTSGQVVASQLGLILPNTHVIPVKNTESDTSASIGELGTARWASEVIGKISKQFLTTSINKESIELAKQIYEVRQQNPNIEIGVGGYSGGGFIVHDAAEISKALAIQLKTVAVGTPHYGTQSTLNSDEFKSIIADKDPVLDFTNSLKPFLGNLSKEKTVVTEGDQHGLSAYLLDPVARGVIQNQLIGKIVPDRYPGAIDSPSNPALYKHEQYKYSTNRMYEDLPKIIGGSFDDENYGENLELLNVRAMALAKGFSDIYDDLPYGMDEEAERFISSLKDVTAVLDLMGDLIESGGSKEELKKLQNLKLEPPKPVIKPVSFAKQQLPLTAPLPLSSTIPLKNNLNARQAENVSIDLASHSAISQDLNKQSESLLEAFNEDLSEKISVSVKEIQSQLLDKNYDISSAKNSFQQIREAFKKSYAAMQAALKAGDLKLAKAHGDTILKVSEFAKTDIAEIQKILQSKNIPSHFGSELSSLVGSTKGVITSAYVKPTKRELQKINNEEQKGKFVDVGKDVIGGLTQGLKSSGRLEREASDTALIILNAMKKTLGIQSPSRRFREEVAKPIIQGLNQGLQNSASLLQSVSQLSQDLINKFNGSITGQKTIGGIENWKKNIIATFKLLGKDIKNVAIPDLLKDLNLDKPLSAISAIKSPSRKVQLAGKQLYGFASNKATEVIDLGVSATESIKKLAEQFTQSAKGQTFQNSVKNTKKNIVDGLKFVANDFKTTAVPDFLRFTGVTQASREIANQISRATRYANVLKKSALTPTPGSNETSYQQLINRVVPRNIRENFGKGASATPDLVMQAFKQGENLLKSPTPQKGLLYYYKYVIKGMSDVTEQVYRDVSSFFDRLEQKAKGSKYLGDLLTPLTGGMKNLSLTAIAGTAAFFRFFSMTKYLGYLQQLVSSVLATATAFESLNRAFINTAKNELIGSESLSKTVKLSKDLKLGYAETIENSSAVQLSLRSRIPDANTIDKIVAASNQAGKVYGATPQARSSISQGIASLGQSPVVTGQDFYQLSNSIPDALSIGSRATGVTEQEFSKLMKEGLSSSDFIPAFAQQLEMETAPKITRAMDTLESANTRYANSVTDLQLTFSNLALPMEKLRINVFSGAIENLTKVSSSFGVILSGLALYGVTKFTGALFLFGGQALNLARQIPYLSSAILALSRITTISLASSIPIITKLLGEFVLFQVIADSVTVVTGRLSDASGDIGTFATQSTENIKKFTDALKIAQDSTKSFVETLPQTFNQIKGKTYLDDTFFGNLIPDDWGRTVEKFLADTNKLSIIHRVLPKSFRQTRVEKESEQRTTALDTAFTASSSRNKSVDDQLNDPASALNKLKVFNKQLDDIQGSRRAYAINDPSNASAQNNLKAQELEVIKRKEKLQAPIDLLSSGVNADIQGYTSALAEYEVLASKGLVTQEEYTRHTKDLKEAIIASQSAQEKLNTILKSSFTPLQAFQRAWEKISDTFEDSKNNLENLNKVNLTQISRNERTGVVSQGQSDYSRSLAEINLANEQLQSSVTAFKRFRAELIIQDAGKTFSKLGLTDKSSPATIKAVAERSDQFPKEKALLEKFGNVKELENQIIGQQQTVEDAKNNLAKQLIGFTNSVRDYYLSISRTTQQQLLDTQKTTYSASITNQQANLRKAIRGGYDTIVSQFIDSIVSTLDSVNEIEQTKINLESDLLQNRNSLQDTLRQGYELQKTLPGELPKIPVELDVSTLMAEQSIQTLRDSIDGAVGNTQQLSEGLSNSIGESDGLYASLFNNTTPLNEINTSLIQSTESMNNLGNRADTVVEKSKNIAPSIKETNTVLDFISQKFQGILNIIESIRQTTLQWIENLKHTEIAKGLQSGLQGAGNVATGLGDTMYNGLGAAQNWLSNLTGIGKTNKFSIYDSNNGSVIKSYDNLTRHHANRGREAGRNYGQIGGKQEEINAQGMLKKDMVLKQNGSDNVPVPSPASGYARLHAPLGQVGIYSQQQGGDLLAKVLHLANFKVKEGQQVKYGQTLGIQGTKGGGSTGVHLHVEGTLPVIKKYVSDLLNGDFSQELGRGQTVRRNLGNANMQDTRANVIDTRQASGDTSGLTALGKKYLAASQTKQFQAMAYAIGIAETGNILGNNGMAYGAAAGDYKTAKFKNFASLTAVPASAGGAFGNYQINQQDNSEAQKLLGVRNLSKRDQDIIGAWRLDRHNALDPVLKGDLRTAMQRGGKEFGSFEGAPVGGHSSTGKFSVMQANFNKYLSLTNRNAANNIAPIQTNLRQKNQAGQILQNRTSDGMDFARENAAKREAQLRKQAEATIAKEKENQRISTERAIRTLRDQSRQLGLDSRNEKKQANDASFNAIFNPTIAQKNKKAEDDIKYEVLDLKEKAEIDLEKVRANAKDTKFALKNTILPAEQRKVLEENLPKFEAREKALEEHIKRIKQLENERLNFQKKTAEREESLRVRDQSFSERQRDIDLLQERINKLNTLKASQPFSSEVQQLPDLQKVLDFKKDELLTDQERAKLKDDLFSRKIDQSSFDKQTASLNQKSQLARDSIQVRSQQQLTQQEIDRIKRDNETRKSEQENFAASAQLNLQRLLDKPTSTRPEDLLSAREQVYQSDINAETINYEAKRLEYKQLEATDNSQPGHIKKLYEDLDKLHIANLDQLKAKYELTLAMDKSDDTKRQIESRTQINDQLDKINTGRLAEVERLISKTANVSPIQTIRQSQYRQQTYINSVNAQQQSYLEEKNKIDDLEINNKRTPAQIKELRENLEALNNISLNGFKTTLKDALDTDTISRFQKRIDLLTNQQYLESSNIDLRKARITRDTTRGSNPFAINSRQRNVGRDEENNRYALEILELDKKMADLRSTGVNIPEKAVNNIKENLFQIHSINLDNLNDQFKTFGSTIDDIAKTGLQGLSQSLADVITEGGDLGSVFNNLFKTIANGFIKNGLDSLIGGLTGSLFGGGNKKSSGLGGGLLDFVGGIFGGSSGGGLLSILGFAEGGTVPAISGQSLRTTTTQIGQALRKEGSNAVLATLTPGERVLTTKENEIYNLVHPGGIEASYKALNFNEGGNVGEMSRQVTNRFNSIGNTSNSPVINIQKDENPDLSGADKQSVKMIRAVVVAEMKRQNAPGGINNRSK